MRANNRQIKCKEDPSIAPTQKQTNPNANAISIETGSAGVPKKDVTVAMPSPIQSGNNSPVDVVAVGWELSAFGGAYGFTDG